MLQAFRVFVILALKKIISKTNVGDLNYKSRIWFLSDRLSPADMVLIAGKPLTGHLFSQIPQPMHLFRSTKGSCTFICLPSAAETTAFSR